MSKMKRNERVGAIVKILCDSPNQVYPLGYFTKIFQAAKSTISEDVVVVKQIIKRLSCGYVETISGAAGGVRYVPGVSTEDKESLLSELCTAIGEPKRKIPGGFVYIADLLYNPKYLKRAAGIFAQEFSTKGIDCVMTVETKGIPLATMTANSLNVPLVIARYKNKVTEGSTVSVNYVSGSTGRVQTMYIAKSAVQRKMKVLIVDDFMRGGGTAKGMETMVEEMGAHVEGIAVLIETTHPKNKMVQGYVSLLTLDENSQGEIRVFSTKQEI